MKMPVFGLREYELRVIAKIKKPNKNHLRPSEIKIRRAFCVEGSKSR
jgi:outer membrane lipopolysaccharide assembly protein LptE/RlpB